MILLPLLVGIVLGGTKRRQLRLREDAQIDSVLLNLNDEFYSDDQSIVRRFSVQQQVRGNLLAVDSNGDVKLSAPIDHEELCTSSVCHFTHTIMVMPQDVFERIELDIILIDVNDNAPHFRQSKVAVDIAEGEQSRIEVPLLIADDADASSELTYSIEDDDLFKLEMADGRAFLVLKTALDYELTKSVQTTVHVHDQDGRRDSTQLIVTVLDRNDAAPIFRQGNYHIEIGELNEIHSQVYVIQASDEDSADNGILTYDIVSAEPSQARSLFTIDANTGAISNTRIVQRQDFDSIKLTIKASDGGVPSLSTETTLTIAIMDTNDHAPTILLTPCQTSSTEPNVAIVNENEQPGAFVVWYSVSDLDLEQNGKTDIRIEPANLFRLIADDGLIVTSVAFDREEQSSYELTVIACDRGQPKRCADNTIEIQVADVNDNAPVMSDKRIDVSFREDIKIGSKLFQVYATDRDDPVNYGKVRFRLENEQSYYKINADTGEVFLQAMFDYETARSDEFRIIADDAEGKSDFTLVYVSIINTNDNAPVISIPEIVYINADYDITRSLLNITTYDLDGVKPILSLDGQNANLFYLVGSELYLASNVTSGFVADVTIVATDGEDTTSYRVSATVTISTKTGLTPLIAGIIAGCLIFLILITLCILRGLMERKNYKIDYGTIKATANNRDDIVTADSDYEPMMKSTYSDDQLTMKDEIKSKNCSDSGRGESGEDDSILTADQNQRNSREYYGSKYCTKDCYRLGHSDTCWIPSNEADFGIDVTSKMTNQTSLSVCDRTSDYSSQKSIQNNSSREVIV